VRLPVLTLAALLVLSACATNPVSGRKDFVLMSEAQEVELGRQNDPAIRKQYGRYDDAALQAYVNAIGQRVAAKSHRAGLTFHFTVLDSEEVNAFALPGGYVYITRGILAYLQSEAELAAVLGHEIGHVTARHGVRQYTAATAAGLGATLASVFVPGLGSASGQQLVSVLGNALLSGYGREHELEADRLGAQYLARSGYDPDAMIGVIGVLKNQEEFEKQRAAAEGRAARIYHGVFASHPSADQRLQQVVREAHQYKTSATTGVAREEFLRHLDGLAFGDSEAQGIRRGQRFYHRTLNLTLAFPEGWRLANRPDALLATSPDGQGLLQLMMEPVKGAANPRDFLHARLKQAPRRAEQALDGARYPSHSLLTTLNTPFGQREVRVVTLFYGEHAYTFLGTAKTDGAMHTHEPQFRATALSLRPLGADEQSLARGLRLHLRAARAGERFHTLAQGSALGPQAEALLRLLNGKFPDGEPRAGERIKLID
jgi:predicted Zn-dependent protease